MAGLTERQMKVLDLRVSKARALVQDLKPKLTEPEAVTQARALVADWDEKAKAARDAARRLKEQELQTVNEALAFGASPSAIVQAVDRYEAWCNNYERCNK